MKTLKYVLVFAVTLTLFGSANLKAFVDLDADGWWDIRNYNDLVTLSSNSAYWNGQYEIRLPYPQVNIVVPTFPTPNLIPIGNAITPFSGKFRGLDPTDSDLNYRGVQYKIIGLRQYFPGQDNIGLIGVNTGEITNIVLSKAVTTGNDVVGAFCGLNKGRIYNCQFYINDEYAKTIVTGNTKVGGFIGCNLDTVANCIPTVQRLFNYTYVEVTGDYHVGGFVGYNSSDTSQILNCEVYNTKLHDGSNAYGFGGFVGYNQGRILNSYVRGYTTVEDNIDSGLLGGFVGNSVGGSILNCGVSDSVTVGTPDQYSNYTGGFAGKNIVSIQYSNSGALVYGNGYVGGFIGLDSGDVSHCESKGSIYASDSYAGGFVGLEKGIISNCDVLETCSVYGNDYVGGFIGLDSGNVQNCESKSLVFADDDYVGGFVGYEQGTVTRCFVNSNCTVSANASDYVGGFAGANFSEITLSASKANVEGNIRVGGFTGTNYGDIFDCYSRGGVAGSGGSAGFVGVNEISGEIQRCFAASSSLLGGVYGFARYDYGFVLRCVWDVTSSGQNLSAAGLGYSTILCKSMIPYPMWDWTNVWELTGENDGYPSFRTISNYKVNYAVKESANNIEIYPYPVSDISTINISDPEKGSTTLSVYNTNGEMVETLYSGDLNTNEYTVNFNANNYTTGMYYLVLESNNNRKMEPIIVKH